MKSFLNPIELGTQAHHQKQTHGQHDLKHLGKQVDTIRPKKEISGQTDAHQANPNPYGSHNESDEIDLFGSDPFRHG